LKDEVEQELGNASPSALRRALAALKNKEPKGEH